MLSSKWLNRKAAFVASTATALMVGSVAAADWPQWRGLNRDGKSTDNDLLMKLPEQGPKMIWSKTEIEDIGTGYGSPAVANGKLYILGGDSAKQTATEMITCLNASTGEKIWQTKFKTSTGNYNDNWGGGPRSTPTLDGDNIYTLGSTGDLCCLNASDGSIVWSKNIVKDFGGKIPTWGYSESVLIDGDILLVTPGNAGGITALNKTNGEKIWTCTELKDGAGYSSILVADIAGVKQYITQTMESGVGVRASDGKLLWRVNSINRRVAVIPTPIIKDDHVFFTAGYGAGCELYKIEKVSNDKLVPKLIYKSGLVANHHGGVIEVNGKLYGHSDNKSVWLCLDYLKDGEEPLWTSNKLEKGSITYADGHLYCYGENKGTLVRILATDEQWTETGRFTIPELSKIRPRQGRVWAHPVVANGLLYLRDYEKFYCYGVGKNSAE